MRQGLYPVLFSDPIDRWAKDAVAAWDFLENRARWNGGRIGALANTPGWTHTGTTHSAGGVLYAVNQAASLVTFPSGVLRRTDKGVLIEGARTNLCLQSQTFDNASWTKTNSTVTADVAVATDGTTTADTLTDDATNADHKVRQGIAVTSGTAYTFSVYAKANTLNYVWLYVGTPNVGTCFNLAAGTVLGSVGGTPTSSTISALGNGWYRCSITYTAGATSTQNHDIGTSANGTSFNYVGTGQNVYIWGAQLEAASFPSSYIPTTTASATRAADVLSITGVTGLAYPLSLFAEFERAVDMGGTETLAEISDATSANYLRVFVNGSDQGACSVNSGSVSQAGVAVTGSIALATTTKLAARVAANSVQTARGGSLGTEDTAVTVPATPTRIHFGQNEANANLSFGYLRRAFIANYGLSDSSLQAITPA